MVKCVISINELASLYSPYFSGRGYFTLFNNKRRLKFFYILKNNELLIQRVPKRCCSKHWLLYRQQRRWAFRRKPYHCWYRSKTCEKKEASHDKSKDHFHGNEDGETSQKSKQKIYSRNVTTDYKRGKLEGKVHKKRIKRISVGAALKQLENIAHQLSTQNHLLKQLIDSSMSKNSVDQPPVSKKKISVDQSNHQTNCNESQRMNFLARVFCCFF